MPPLLAILLALLPLAAPARADILLPGHRPVSHQLVIEASELWTGKRIVAFPVRGVGGTHVVEPGQPFGFSSKYGTRLYVATGSEPVPDSADAAWTASHVAAAIPVSEVSSVPLISPLEAIVTTLRIRALDGARFELEVVDESRRNDPRLIGLWWSVALFGGFGMAWLIRRRRRASRAG